ncbi:u37-Nephitoxin-Nsp1b_1 [Trichonephila inaurata madagascariensis]|uniref:U37-Nephitoxin-Nsp1b_1 n=1 Tax=Trichonephila inaurata madagascariensis TaxID=2747483 RepID=A0A8X7BMX3_9ARAC|nr:u37-Nephitoxin-Nsp1b_1 [Trichonephila inaurata madagascariensis]
MLKLVLLVALAALAYGAFEKVDISDEGVVEAAHAAAKALSKQWPDKYHHRFVKVLKAKKEDFNGVSYEMDIIVGMTVCKKSEVEYEEAENCEFRDSISTYKKCTVTISKDLKGAYKLKRAGCILASKSEI